MSSRRLCSGEGASWTVLVRGVKEASGALGNVSEDFCATIHNLSCPTSIFGARLDFWWLTRENVRRVFCLVKVTATGCTVARTTGGGNYSKGK